MNLKLCMMVTLFFAVHFSVHFGHADDGKQNKKYVVCKNKKEVRTIRVDCKPNGIECETIYSKYGKDFIEGNNNNVLGGQKILENIKVNLEKASWECSDKTNKTQIVD